jgi:uncharacterized protein YecE (DUF72 family)
VVAYHPLNVLVGTSGYSYKEWKGGFYPQDLKDGEMLRFYAERFPAVEINNTFYRMPSPELLARWAAEVPASFRFILKAPRRITHEKRLAGVADTTARLFEVAASLGDKRGPFLFQLPPYSKKDAARLRDFLGLLPAGERAAFEFRDPSWDDDEVSEALRAAGAARCLADTDEDQGEPRLVPTARFGYLRLRRADYDEAALVSWADRIRSQPWDEAFVFFKHEDEARGPQLASRLLALLRA